MIDYELISPWFEPLTEEESQFFLNDQNQTIYREIVGNYGWRSKAPHLYNFRNTNNKEKELFDFININLQITSTDNEEVKGDIYDILLIYNSFNIVSNLSTATLLSEKENATTIIPQEGEKMIMEETSSAQLTNNNEEELKGDIYDIIYLIN
jgi:hypothetical protein